MPVPSSTLGRIDILRAEIDAERPLSPEQEARIFQKFRLWWTYHSNAIEGNTLTQGETETFLMEGLTAKGKPLKDHLDIRGHHDAINFLLEFIRRDEVLTEAVIRELHSVLLGEPYEMPAETPDGQRTRRLIKLGEYKTEPNHVRTPTGEIHYYARPEETPARMGDLMRWYRETTAAVGVHVVEIAARFHHEFAAIHPFDDGNGRMSRLLMNLILMQAGFPPVVIRLGDRNAYLFALQKADQGDEQEFVEFIAERLVEALDLYLRGARGGELHEPSDLEKEIKLLKGALPPIQEPVRWNPKVIRELLHGGIARLFDRAAHHLGEMSELFASHEVTMHCHSQRGLAPVDYRLDLKPGAFEVDEKMIESPLFPLGMVSVRFTFRGLRQTPANPFNVSGSIDVVLDDWAYRIRILPSGAEFNSHDYVTQLSDEEVQTIGDHFVRQYLDAVRRWVGLES